MAGEVLVDALPYIDQGYDDPEVRDAALLLVEEECRRYRPTKNYLEHLPQLNVPIVDTELMKNELERIQNRVQMEPLNMKRYELPLPPLGKSSELSAWTECVDNSVAQLEHQATRAINLELMLEYGCETWKSYLEILTSLQAKAQNELQIINKEIQEVNWQRKTNQKEAGEKLKVLEDQWVTLVSKNYEIEQVCADLEKQIYETKMAMGILTTATNDDQMGDDNEDEETDSKVAGDQEADAESNDNKNIEEPEQIDENDDDGGAVKENIAEETDVTSDETSNCGQSENIVVLEKEMGDVQEGGE